MRYLDQLAHEIGRRCGMNPEEREELRLLRIFAVLGLAKRSAVTLADVHDAWSAWKLDIDPAHRAIVPFGGLSADVQELDRIFRDAIVEAVVWFELSERGRSE